MRWESSNIHMDKIRPSRLREKPELRKLFSEIRLAKEDLVMPLFFKEGKGKDPIDSMPGIFKLGEDDLLREIESLEKTGIKAVILFASTLKKDGMGSSSYDENSPFHCALRKIRKASNIIIIADVCLCAYTDHGHCGIIGSSGNDMLLDNKKTLGTLSRIAVSYADSGADIVAPSAMADGQVKAIRCGLDTNGFTGISILSYSVKYASAFYGPFRDIYDSSPISGDRKRYQLDPANRIEAVKEAKLDVEEGADIVMVKPAFLYLDVIKTLKETVNVPVAAYNVSGEYSMVKSASSKGWLDETACVQEMLTSIKRAGANIIITYWAKTAAKWTGV